MHLVPRYILLFVTYSLMGVIVELVFGLIVDHQINGVGHGFLLIPIMPIYGFGAMFILFIRRWLRRPILLFIGSMLVTTLFEFISHWFFQVVFGIQYWDYSNKPYNIDGRISLDSSIGFGVVAVLLVHVIHPAVSWLLDRISKRWSLILAVLTGAVLIVETANSFIKRLS